jgi:hypothetical protein
MAEINGKLNSISEAIDDIKNEFLLKKNFLPESILKVREKSFPSNT